MTRPDASRANGAHSHGPATPEGKARASRNALKHGLTGGSLVLTNESQPLFDQLHAGYVERFQPADPVECDLVLDLAVAKWRQRRCWSIETALLDYQMTTDEPSLADRFDSVDEETRLALAFMHQTDHTGALRLLARYEASARRNFDRALHALSKLKNCKTNPSPAAHSEF